MKTNNDARFKLIGVPIAVIVAAIAVPGLHGAPAQQARFRASVELIEVDVSVVDNDRRPVEDLRSSEFQVTVDGEPRQVVSAEFIQFDTVSDERPRAEPAEVFYSSNEFPERGRLIILGVDHDNIAFGEGASATRAASRFVQLLGANDRVGLVALPQPGPYVDLTSNRALVQETIDGIVGLQQPTDVTFRLGLHEAFAIANREDQVVAVETTNRICGQFEETSLEWELCSDRVELDARRIVGDLRTRNAQSLRQLESIVKALQEVEGPKHVIWISAGLALDGPGSAVRSIARLAAAARVTIHVLMLDTPLVDITAPELLPHAREDRSRLEQGLQMLASMTRGTLRRVGPNANAVLERLEVELSGYYLLGVEARESDRDGEAHAIDVSVDRRGTYVRARREFVSVAPSAENVVEDVDARLRRTLRTPFAVTQLPLRVATYAFQAPDDPTKVNVVVVTETDGGNRQGQNVSLGFTLANENGGLATSELFHPALDVVERPDGPLRRHMVSVIVEPGRYRLKMAVIDADGRSGSVEHQVQAWQLADVPFATSDLVLADAKMQPDSGLRPPVEARLSSGQLRLYTELYADASDFGDVQVLLEVAEDEFESPRWSAAAVTAPGNQPNIRIVSGVLPVDALPPGRYVARAVVLRGDERLARPTRPFQVAAPPAGSPVAATSRDPNSPETTLGAGTGP